MHQNTHFMAQKIDNFLGREHFQDPLLSGEENRDILSMPYPIYSLAPSAFDLPPNIKSWIRPCNC